LRLREKEHNPVVCSAQIEGEELSEWWKVKNETPDVPVDLQKKKELKRRRTTISRSADRKR